MINAIDAISITAITGTVLGIVGTILLLAVEITRERSTKN